ncbi:MAG: DUF1294 domain-containing protein [Saprospiraceae bacterium]|nr:DUF1294 domain-containing protein [Saprospiraceae bacterium]
MTFSIYLLLINIVAYALMWKDKNAAKSKQWRIAERHLWFWAIIGGSLGIYLGTRRPLYHKATRKTFTIGLPLLILSQVVVVVSIMI